MKTGIELIAEERKRQIEEEGFTAEHDNSHTEGALADAGVCYAQARHYEDWRARSIGEVPRKWPWSLKWWKPTTYLRNLVKAGALIAAEIDRLQRLVG